MTPHKLRDDCGAVNPDTHQCSQWCSSLENQPPYCCRSDHEKSASGSRTTTSSANNNVQGTTASGLDWRHLQTDRLHDYGPDGRRQDTAEDDDDDDDLSLATIAAVGLFSSPDFFRNQTLKSLCIVRLLCTELCVRVTLAAVGFYYLYCCPPFIRRVWPSDWAYYAFPYAEDEAFPLFKTMMMSMGLSFFFLFIGLFVLRVVLKWTTRQLSCEALLFLLGGTLTVGFGFVACEITKRMYGRLRPDFLARCLGPGTLDDWLAEWGWRSLEDIPEIPDCSHSPLPERIVEDGRMSFPSEHSCLTTALLTYDAFWVYTFFTFAILVFPLIVALSRTSDYRHHASDVAIGSILGLVIGLVCFHFYFPPDKSLVLRRPRRKTTSAAFEDHHHHHHNIPIGAELGRRSTSYYR